MYKHTVQYYETDKMGITHHSNYIRWMEETRVALLDEMGYGYDKLEEAGIISPVINVNCNYKKTTTFPEVITIDAYVKEFNGVKMTLSYVMKNSSDETVCEAQSSHAFLNNKGMPIRLKKEYPDFYDAILSNMNAEQHHEKMAIINKKCAKRQKMLYNPTEETASSVTQAKSVIDEMAEKAVNVSDVANGLAADSEKWIL